MRYPEKSYYDSLGVPPNANREQIKHAYRQQMKFFHPDVFPGSPEIADSKAKELNEAYEVLSSFPKKQLYDAWLRETAYLQKQAQEQKRQEQARAAEQAKRSAERARAAQKAAQAYYDQWWHAYAAQQVAADEQAKKAQEAYEAKLREEQQEKLNKALQFWTKTQKVFIVMFLSLLPLFGVLYLLLECGIVPEELLMPILSPYSLITVLGLYITEFFSRHFEKKLKNSP